MYSDFKAAKKICKALKFIRQTHRLTRKDMAHAIVTNPQPNAPFKNCGQNDIMEWIFRIEIGIGISSVSQAIFPVSVYAQIFQIPNLQCIENFAMKLENLKDSAPMTAKRKQIACMLECLK